MFVVIPIVCWVLLYLYFYRISEGACRRQAFLSASVVWGVIIVLMTELLSLPELLAFPFILSCWLLMTAGAAGLLLWANKHKVIQVKSEQEPGSKFYKILLVCMVLYVATIGMIALIAPPNSWDVMEYHMPKVMHWIQNHTIKFIPTNMPRINHQSSGSEFVIMQFQVLAGSDRFANMVEWFSMAGSLIAVSFIAKQLGAGIRGQILAAVITLTLPAGIMQASSSQADYVSAFWLACFIAFMFQINPSKKIDYTSILLAAGAIGMAIVTKATTYVYAPPFVLWFLCCYIRSHKQHAVKPLMAMAAIVVVLNAGQWVRNYDLHHNILGPGQEPIPHSRYTNEIITPRSVLSNTVKYAAIHLNTPWPKVQDRLAKGVESFHRWIGMDINDPRMNWGPESMSRFRIEPIKYFDESDGNPIHLILFLLCMLLIPCFKRLRKEKTVILYGLSVITAFILFALYVKWTYWNTRVHLTVFVLAGPFIAGVLIRLFKQAWITHSIAVFLLLLGLPWLFNCQQRPVLGKHNIFTMSRFDLCFTHGWRNNEEDYLAMRAFLKDKDISQIGLCSDTMTCEYITWVLLKPDHPAVRFQHVMTDDVSRCKNELPRFRCFEPEVVISLYRDEQDVVSIKDIGYTKKWSQGLLAIYEKEIKSHD